MIQEHDAAQTEIAAQPQRESGSSPSQSQTGLATKVLKLLSSIKTMRRMGRDEERYVAPPRLYELPPYRAGMKFCTSNEEYLRPKHHTDPRDHNVIALAHELGAFELSDRDYAEAAYWWMKANTRWEVTKWCSAGQTLSKGAGTCWHLNSTYAALCRCAGIKSRFKAFDTRMFEYGAQRLSLVDSTVGNPLGRETLLPEAEVEVFIDGEWVSAYVAQPSNLTAGAGWPVTEFGESGVGLYFDEVPGSVHLTESVPLKMIYPLSLMNLLVPATIERLNVKMTVVQARGRSSIESAGGIEAYNERARKRRAELTPNQILAQMSAERRRTEQAEART
jgi:transglutaminase-like putative cysteine protease